MAEKAFRVEASVIAALANGTYEVEMINGHRLTAFIARKNREKLLPVSIGQSVKLQLTPYDLSVGRILVETKKDL